MSDLEARIINDLVMFGDDDKPKEPVKQERITARDLTSSEIPYKRDTKKRPNRHRARGEQFTKNTVRAVYQTPEQVQAAHDKNPGITWVAGLGETNIWNGNV
jgi:hypothetical protein